MCGDCHCEIKHVRPGQLKIRSVYIDLTEFRIDGFHGEVRNNCSCVGVISKCARRFCSLDHTQLVVDGISTVVANRFQHVARVTADIDLDVAQVPVGFHGLQRNLGQPSRNGIKHQRRVASILNLLNNGCHIITNNVFRKYA